MAVRPRDGRDGPIAFTEAVNAWIGRKRPLREEPLSLEIGCALMPSDGNVLRWEPYLGDSNQLLELTYRHPDRDDPDISWSTQAAFIGAHGAQQISLRVWNNSPSEAGSEQRLTTRPRLVNQLIEAFSLSMRGQVLKREPRILFREDIATFVRYELFDPRRAHPILVVAPAADGTIGIDPVSLAEDFLTLAEVVVLNDVDAGFELTREIGDRRLSCFHGGIRVYHKGFHSQADPYQHPLLVARAAVTVGARLRLAKQLALGTTRDFLVSEDLLALRDERAVATEERRRSLEDRLRQASGFEDDSQLAHEYARENDLLRGELDDLREQLRVAEGKIRGLHFALTAQGHEPDTGLPELDFVPQSVEEAVEYSQGLAPDSLRVLDSANASASDCPFKSPELVLQALKALGEVASRLASGPLGKNLEDVFLDDYGLCYAGGVDETMKPHLLKEYHFTHRDEMYKCYEHLKIGNKSSYDPTLNARIYFTRVSEGPVRIVVGHVGRHLDSSATT